jgi:hypothetical protein
MKKLVLSSICGVLALVMVGCGSNGSAQTTKDLSNQVNRLQNTVTNISTSAIYDVTPTNYLYNQPLSNDDTSSSRLRVLMTDSQSAFAEHEALRQEIMNRSATLKSALGQKYKFSNNKIKALKTITSTLSGYNTDITGTTHKVSNATNLIKRSKNLNSFDSDTLNVGYTKLNNELENRITFFKNVLSAFDQVEAILREGSVIENNSEQNNAQTDNNTNQEGTTQSRRKNIDTFGNNRYFNGTNNQPNCTNDCNNNINNIANNGMNGNFNYANGYNYNGVNGYGYNNGIGYNGMYNNAGFYGYGFNRPFSPFNFGRNTDTYLPVRRNIDTYRPIAPIENNIVEASADMSISENVDKIEDEVGDEVKESTDSIIDKATMKMSEEGHNKIEKNIISNNRKRPGHVISKRHIG